MSKSYEDAVLAFEKVISKRNQNVVAIGDEDAEEEATMPRISDDMSGGEENGGVKGDDQSSEVDSTADGTIGEMHDDESIVVIMPEEIRDEDAEADFEREFSRMMQDSIESRRNERKPVAFDVAVPGRVKFSNSGAVEDVDGRDSVMFTLLTKKGNKQQVKSFLI